MNSNLHFSSKSNEWKTPKFLFDKLNEEFNFNLDAAASKDNALCKNFFTLEDNSLIQDWQFGTVFCNPPYGREIGKFVKKGYEESLRGCTVVFLIPARTDTKWWHEYCSKGEVRFIKGRLKFKNGNCTNSAPFPSVIVIFNGKNGWGITKYVDFPKV
ncbi:MAG: phage N-6-adenine-methyltransferase [Nanoarchaeota archaeon]